MQAVLASATTVASVTTVARRSADNNIALLYPPPLGVTDKRVLLGVLTCAEDNDQHCCFARSDSASKAQALEWFSVVSAEPNLILLSAHLPTRAAKDNIKI